MTRQPSVRQVAGRSTGSSPRAAFEEPMDISGGSTQSTQPVATLWPPTGLSPKPTPPPRRRTMTPSKYGTDIGTTRSMSWISRTADGKFVVRSALKPAYENVTPDVTPSTQPTSVRGSFRSDLSGQSVLTSQALRQQPFRKYPSFYQPSAYRDLPRPQAFYRKYPSFYQPPSYYQLPSYRDSSSISLLRKSLHSSLPSRSFRSPNLSWSSISPRQFSGQMPPAFSPSDSWLRTSSPGPGLLPDALVMNEELSSIRLPSFRRSPQFSNLSYYYDRWGGGRRSTSPANISLSLRSQLRELPALRPIHEYNSHHICHSAPPYVNFRRNISLV